MKEIKSLKQQVNDLKEWMEFMQNDLEEMLLAFEITMNLMYENQIDPNYVNDSLLEFQNEMSEMEGRSCRNNIRLGGVIEEKGGTWEDCEVVEILHFYLLKYWITT